MDEKDLKNEYLQKEVDDLRLRLSNAVTLIGILNSENLEMSKKKEDNFQIKVKER